MFWKYVFVLAVLLFVVTDLCGNLKNFNAVWEDWKSVQIVKILYKL